MNRYLVWNDKGPLSLNDMMRGKIDLLKKSFILAAILVLGITTATYAGSKEKQANQQEELKTEKTSIQEQLAMLERGIVPTKPDKTIKLWAKAVKERNGALQYALLTEDAKKGTKKSLEQFHWATGASSPWVEEYKVVSKNEQKDESIEYVVEFSLATSTGKAGKDSARLILVKKDEQWFIQSIAPANKNAIGIWSTPEAIKEINSK